MDCRTKSMSDSSDAGRSDPSNWMTNRSAGGDTGGDGGSADGGAGGAGAGGADDTAEALFRAGWSRGTTGDGEGCSAAQATDRQTMSNVKNSGRKAGQRTVSGVAPGHPGVRL